MDDQNVNMSSSEQTEEHGLNNFLGRALPRRLLVLM